jgi:hypothetical protein
MSLTKRYLIAKEYVKNCELPTVAPNEKLRNSRYLRGVKNVKKKHNIKSCIDLTKLEKKYEKATEKLNRTSVKVVRESIVVPKFYSLMPDKFEVALQAFSYRRESYFYISTEEFITLVNMEEPLELVKAWSKNYKRRLFVLGRSDVIIKYHLDTQKYGFYVNPYIQEYFTRPRRRAVLQIQHKYSDNRISNDIRNPDNYFTVKEYFDKLNLHKQYLTKMEDTFISKRDCLKNIIDKLTLLDSKSFLEYEKVTPRYVTMENFYMKIDTPIYKGFVLVHHKKSIPNEKKYRFFYMTSLGTGVYEDSFVRGWGDYLDIIHLSVSEIESLALEN